MDEAEQSTPAQLMFFQRLHKMITNARIRSDCIDWLPEGNGFIITNKANFEDVLSVYFPNAKTSSFFRRLKRWGFNRLPTMSGAFEHSVFRRGMTFDDGDLDDYPSLLPSSSSAFFLAPRDPPSQLFPFKSQNDEPSFDIPKEDREKRRDMTPSGGKAEAAQALASLGSSKVAHQGIPREELQMDNMRLSHEATALSRARSYSPQMTMDMMQRHHEQFLWRYYQDLQRQMAPEYGIDGRESFQPPSPLQRQVMVPDTWKAAPEAKHVSCVSTSVDEQPDLASLQKIRQDLDDSRRELLNRNVDDSFCQLTGDSSGRVPLPNSLAVRSPYNRAA